MDDVIQIEPKKKAEKKTEKLVQIIDNRIVVSSRQIASHFQISHEEVLSIIHRFLDNDPSLADFFQETTYTYVSEKHPEYLMDCNGFFLFIIEYHLLINILYTEEDFQQNVAYIRAFNDMQTKYLERPAIFREELLQKELLTAQQSLEKNEQQIAELAPKGLFADALMAAKRSISISSLAELLRQNGVNIGQKQLLARLRKEGFLIKDGIDKNLPTQWAIKDGLFKVKEKILSNNGDTNCITRTTKVTVKGQIYFVYRFLTKWQQDARSMDGTKEDNAERQANIERLQKEEREDDQIRADIARRKQEFARRKRKLMSTGWTTSNAAIDNDCQREDNQTADRGDQTAGTRDYVAELLAYRRAEKERERRNDSTE